MKRKPDKDDRYDQSAFSSVADIISNLLGILTVVILIATLSIGFLKEIAENSAPKESVFFEFKTKKREWFPYWSQFYIVVEDRMTKVDLKKLSGKITDDYRRVPPNKVIEIATASERIHLTGLGTSSDIDVFILEYQINRDWLINTVSTMGVDDLDLFLKQKRNAFRKDRTVPAFFVYPSGMALFSKIHKRLVASGIPYKWTTVFPGKHPHIYRSKIQFDTEGFYFN